MGKGFRLPRRLWSGDLKYGKGIWDLAFERSWPGLVCVLSLGDRETLLFELYYTVLCRVYHNRLCMLRFPETECPVPICRDLR
jgi:hypothetical protein